MWEEALSSKSSSDPLKSLPELVDSSANECSSSEDEGDSDQDVGEESLPELLPGREFNFGNPDDWYYLGADDPFDPAFGPPIPEGWAVSLILRR